MYAIMSDLDVNMLENMYPNPSWPNACRDAGDVPQRRGFERQQGSTYFGGDDSTTAVDCVLVAQELSRTYSWFGSSVTAIRMLRIEENNDLSPAIV